MTAYCVVVHQHNSIVQTYLSNNTVKCFLCYSLWSSAGLWWAEPRSTRARGLLVRPGENVTLDCLLPATFTAGTVSWYKQSPAGRPELVVSYPLTNISHVHYGQGFPPNKFSVQSNNSGSILQQLLIHRSKENDAAVYFCGCIDIGDGDTL